MQDSIIKEAIRSKNEVTNEVTINKNEVTINPKLDWSLARVNIGESSFIISQYFKLAKLYGFLSSIVFDIV